MSKMKIAVMGAAGRMGRELIRAVHGNEACTLIGAAEHEGSLALGQDAGLLAGLGKLGVVITDDAPELFAKADAVLDFTVPAASVDFAALAANARIVHVLGTTGLSADDEAKIAAAARHATVIRSGNMSLGVNLLAVMTRKVAQALGDEFDIEIVEMHHNKKIDAPSGTALLLGEAAAEGRGVDFYSAHAPARYGHTGAREEGTIGFASLRGGTVAGEHSVILAGPQERLTLSHSAEDRMIFAHGAVRGVAWLIGREAGRYTMGQVLGL